MAAQRVYIKSTEFQPKNEYILVKPHTFQTEKVTESGLLIPIKQSALDRPSSGQVLSVGKDINDISVDSVILWPQTDGLDIEFDDGMFMLLRYKSIIGSKK